ncbi:MAG TPA: endonuclease/exonuclease/phosphatase family protein [Pirellulaceae bacterium]|nr:endonuclease/exonuclease/phosphatase family protein [Pirellulaceae bacterium]
MKRLTSLIMAALAAVVGWFVLQQAQTSGWKGISLPGIFGPNATQAPPARGNDTIRIATFNIQVFGESKLNDPEAMQTIVAILKNFDLIAIQEVRSITQDILPHLMALLNADGHHYDYAIGPRLGRSNSKEQYAFVFDTQTIEIDRYQLYTVDDPDDLLHREPLVGWFRARGPAPEQAFTFSLVTIHTDPDETNQELDVLDDVFFKVRDDTRRSEDDVIMLGDFNAKATNLRQLGQIKGLAKVVGGETPTNTLHNAQYDNILFQETATTEFNGRGGVFDFLRQYNLTLEQAKRVSDHLPIWAEFSVFEGGHPGPLAFRPQSGTSF